MMYQDILTFWFDDIDQSKWWAKDDGFDKVIIDKFSDIHTAAKHGELFEWRKNAKGRLAEIIILDQFSRNMFRNSPLAFANDTLALVLAQETIASGVTHELNARERSFIYLPFMHSESLKIHEVAVQLYEKNGLADALEFELKHKDIIIRFGRYPHRNKILGRKSTEAEIEFLKQPDSSF